MNITDITNTLEAIKSLPIDLLNERQGMLVALLVEMVNNETSDGEGTELNTCLEGQDWWATLSELTKDAGFTRLGNGHFSAAYSHPLLPNRVIKVGFKKEDSGAAYTAFCRMHQGRPGIPNIYDVQRHAGCYTVVLDKLYECDEDGNDEHFKYVNFARDIIEYNSSEYVDLTGWDGDFVETCKMIRKFFEGIARFDMHAGNIMFTRGDVPYITDPVSFSQKKGGEAFSLEPEVLLKEVEEVLAQRVLDKAVKRHKRKLKRQAFRKIRRERRKERIKCVKRHRAQLLRARMESRQRRRNEDRMKDFVGTLQWAKLWGKHSNYTFEHLEAKVAGNALEHDIRAIQAGGDLWIDKKLDAMFQG